MTSINIIIPVQANLSNDYTPDEQDCINDLAQLLKDLQTMNPNDPTLSLDALCADINHLMADVGRLAQSPRAIDKAMASYISDFIAKVPFGQYTLAQAAAFFTAKDPDTGPMDATILQLIKDGSLSSLESVLSKLIQNPFTPPSP